FDVVIIDEIDAFPYHSDFTLKKAAERAGRRRKRAVINLTATPREKQKWQMLSGNLPYTFVPTRYHGAPLVIPQWMMQSSISKKFSHKIMPAMVQLCFLKRAPTTLSLVFIPPLFLLSTCFSFFKSFLLKENILTSTNQIAQVHAQDVNREEKVAAFRRR